MRVCKHGVPTQNICCECEIGPLPKKFKKPTVDQVAWVFDCINKNIGCSFRRLIYDKMGFGPNAYSELFSAGGQIITNAMALEFYAFDPERNLDESRREIIDSLMAQIEVLRPVYEAAKAFKWAEDYPGNHKGLMQENLFRAVTVAARVMEDSDE